MRLKKFLYSALAVCLFAAVGVIGVHQYSLYYRSHQKTTQLKVIVHSRHGTPLPNVGINVSDSTGKSISSNVTSSKGESTFDLPKGDFRIEASKPGLQSTLN